MLPIFNRIPESYREEFFKNQALLIRSRVRLLCVLTVAIYFFASIADKFINPEEFRTIEVFIGIALLACGGFVIFLNYRVKSLIGAKLNAYLFTALMLALLVRLGLDYVDPMTASPANIAISSAVYVFTLFLVSMIIPWAPGEVVPIWLMHIAAFSIELLYIRQMPGISPLLFSWQKYLDGVIFMSAALALCLVVRKWETVRDIDNFLLLKDVQDKSDQMHKELEWATRIHKTIIPHSTHTDKVDIAVSYLPVYYMGGDYVKFEFQGEDKLIFFMSDVTGHGVPAALLVNRIHAEFERLAKENKQPGVLMKELNDFIKEDFEGSDMFLSAFCGLLNFKKMELLYSNYGHPTQYVYREKDSSIHGLCSQTTLLGVPLDDNNVYQSEIDIDRGDRVFLFTDGITETVDAHGEEFGPERVEDFLRHNHELPVEEFNKALLNKMNTYKDGKFKDDICLLNIGIKYHPGAIEKMIKSHMK